MKKILFVIINLIFAIGAVRAQQEILIKKNTDNTMTATAKINNTDSDLKNLDSKTLITLKPDPGLAGVSYQLFKVNNDNTETDISTQVQGNSIPGSVTTKMKLVVKATGVTDLTISNFGTGGTAVPPVVNTPPIAPVATGVISAEEYLANASFPSQWSDFDGIVKSARRYKPTRNKAFIVLDDRGKLIGNLPVNLDQDDYIYIIVAVPANTEDDYDLEVVGGEYAPVDLQIRSYDAPTIVGTQSKKKKADWAFVAWERGPYTSDQVTFNVKRKDNTTGNYTTIGSYTVRINKLYHVGIGASFVSSRLASPSYDIGINGSGTQTIMMSDDGTRTFATFNVIWYWANTFRYIGRGSVLTRGRDILKEPSFFERFNPTFGVALDNTWRENFFVGGVFEFARGGSLTAGYHYGKFQTLSDKSFVIGETEFTGTKEDIKLQDDWDWGFYFGITLDTRIFNKIVARQ